MNAIFLFVMGIVVGIVIGTMIPDGIDGGLPDISDMVEHIPDLANTTKHIPNTDDVFSRGNESTSSIIERSEVVYQVGDLVRTTPEYEEHYSGSTMITGEVIEVDGRKLHIEKDNGDVHRIDVNWTVLTFEDS